MNNTYVLRDAASRIWPGTLGWPSYVTPQHFTTGEKERNMNQLEITVYAKVRCMSTWRIKRLLRRKGYAFELIDVAECKQPWFGLGGNARSKMLPQVFVGGRLVGGVETIRALDGSGVLDRLVRGEI
jgi:glutaredoxin 3